MNTKDKINYAIEDLSSCEDIYTYLNNTLKLCPKVIAKEMYKILKKKLEYYKKLNISYIDITTIKCINILIMLSSDANNKPLKSAVKAYIFKINEILPSIKNNINTNFLKNIIRRLEINILHEKSENKNIINFLLSDKNRYNKLFSFLKEYPEAFFIPEDITDKLLLTISNKIYDCLITDNDKVYYYLDLLKLFSIIKPSLSYDGKNFIYLLKKMAIKKDIKNSKKKHAIIGELLSRFSSIHPPLTLNELNNKYEITPYESSIIHKCNTFLKENDDEDYAITIDPLSTTQLKDDALTIKKDGNNYILGIHITNIAHSLINEKEYIANSLSILPLKYSSVINKQNFSLDENKHRQTLSVYVVINNTGDILDYKIKRKQIYIAKSFSYKNASKILSSNVSSSLSEGETLRYLEEVSIILSEKNKEKEIYRKCKNLRNQIDIDEEELFNTYRSSSHKIIEECMLLYGNIVSSIMDDNKIPFIYRVHESIDTREFNKLSKLFNIKNDALFCDLFPSPAYSCINLGHEGLNLKSYAHTTRPLGRITDLINQLIIEELYLNTPNPDKIIKWKEKTEALTAYINRTKLLNAYMSDEREDIQKLTLKL
ncbi:MAG: RNB domain-containing ribonuclease [Bacilli bacterium]